MMRLIGYQKRRYWLLALAFQWVGSVVFRGWFLSGDIVFDRGVKMVKFAADPFRFRRFACFLRRFVKMPR